MGLMTSADWARMASDMAQVRADNEASVAFRRGATTLDAQSVRIARAGANSASRADAGGAEQMVGAVVIVGSASLDVQVGDRATVNGSLIEVTFVRPNRRAFTAAAARIVE
jgi:hypothetical protein